MCVCCHSLPQSLWHRMLCRDQEGYNIIGSTGRKQVCANVLTDDTVLVYVCACMEDGIPLQLIKTTFMLHFIRIYNYMYVRIYIHMSVLN